MNLMSLVKRIAPFVLTFAVGLFIASFFVTVSAPSFKFKRGFNKHREYDRQREMRINELQTENDRLRKRVADLEKRDWVLDTVDVPAPPEPPKVSTLPMKSVPSKAR